MILYILGTIACIGNVVWAVYEHNIDATVGWGVASAFALAITIDTLISS